MHDFSTKYIIDKTPYLISGPHKYYYSYYIKLKLFYSFFTHDIEFFFNKIYYLQIVTVFYIQQYVIRNKLNHSYKPAHGLGFDPAW